MKYFLSLFILSGCAHPSSNEMESMTRDVLKAKSNIEIDIKATRREE